MSAPSVTPQALPQLEEIGVIPYFPATSIRPAMIAGKVYSSPGRAAAAIKCRYHGHPLSVNLAFLRVFREKLP